MRPDFRSDAWISAGRVAGTFGGVWVLVALSASHLNLLIGVSTIAAAVATLAMLVFKPTRSVYVAAGLITGVTETATGIGGPPPALVYQHHPVAEQLLPALGIGALLSRLVHQRVNSRALRVFVMSFSIVSGAVLLIRA